MFSFAVSASCINNSLFNLASQNVCHKLRKSYLFVEFKKLRVNVTYKSSCVREYRLWAGSRQGLHYFKQAIQCIINILSDGCKGLKFWSMRDRMLPVVRNSHEEKKIGQSSFLKIFQTVIVPMPQLVEYLLAFS